MSEGPVIIGVTGGSGSGKTSVCREIFKQFQGKSIMMLSMILITRIRVI